ncbi:hypothetical protein L484_009318 [Morus notabilis]|uniref:Choline-phosphate cytidylyltransferase B n=1 Tax=Morus notabilis TaxID=981085 RepID=W9QT19_9ROSA|nr:hypothetical protein L484_009318 [Morus notabilis]
MHLEHHFSHGRYVGLVVRHFLFNSAQVFLYDIKASLHSRVSHIQIQTVAKTAGMHRNEWVENADRLVAGFLEMFEEGCHKMGTAIRERIQERLGQQSRDWKHLLQNGKGDIDDEEYYYDDDETDDEEEYYYDDEEYYDEEDEESEKEKK